MEELDASGSLQWLRRHRAGLSHSYGWHGFLFLVLGAKAVLVGAAVAGSLHVLRTCCENRAQKQLGAELCVDKAGTSCLLCPLGWLQQGPWCYSVSDAFSSWEGSRANCITRHARLLVPEDEAEMDFLARHKRHEAYYWIGLRIQGPAGNWSWVGDPSTRGIRLRMPPGPPQEQCGAFRDKQSIYPDLCRTEYRWICQRRALVLA